MAGFVKEVLANTGVVTSAGPDDGRSCRPARERFGVKVLDFDGTQDALLHPFDVAGNPHMEYVRQRGSYDDLALDAIFEGLAAIAPVLSATGPADHASASSGDERQSEFREPVARLSGTGVGEGEPMHEPGCAVVDDRLELLRHSPEAHQGIDGELRLGVPRVDDLPEVFLDEVLQRCEFRVEAPEPR